MKFTPKKANLTSNSNTQRKKNIPYVIIIGTEEVAKNECTVKNIITGHQTKLSLKELINFNF